MPRRDRDVRAGGGEQQPSETPVPHSRDAVKIRVFLDPEARARTSAAGTAEALITSGAETAADLAVPQLSKRVLGHTLLGKLVPERLAISLILTFMTSSKKKALRAANVGDRLGGFDPTDYINATVTGLTDGERSMAKSIIHEFADNEGGRRILEASQRRRAHVRRLTGDAIRGAGAALPFVNIPGGVPEALFTGMTGHIDVPIYFGDRNPDSLAAFIRVMAHMSKAHGVQGMALIETPKGGYGQNLYATAVQEVWGNMHQDIVPADPASE